MIGSYKTYHHREDPSMEFEYKILPVRNDLFASTNRKPRKKITRKTEKKKENSEEKQTDGVIVNLSVTNDKADA